MDPPLVSRSSADQFHELDEKQSLAAVQIFINAATACIAHTRELIPWVSGCFQARYVNQLQFDAATTDDLYAMFCTDPVEQNENTQEFRILRRGHDERADVIINMLEGGVTDALKQGFLRAFQIFIAIDPTDPASTVEAYMFSFEYDGGHVSQVTITNQETSHFLIKNAQRSFATSIRALLKSLRALPRLPRRRSLGMSLLYNDECPHGYHPSGFMDIKQIDQVPLRGSWTDLWLDSPGSLTEFSAGLRKVSIGARYLQFVGGVSCSRLKDMEMSAQLKRMQKTSSQNPALQLTADVASNVARATLSNENEDDNEGMIAQNSAQKDTKNYAKEPMPVNSQPSLLSKSVNSLASLSVKSKHRRRRNVVVSKIAELLVQARALENHHRGNQELFDEAYLKGGRVHRVRRLGPVKCECGCLQETSDMLLCELCGTKQHKRCYGYEALRSSCLPEDHFCYDCLLLPREDRVSCSMPDIVYMRLALLFLASQPTGEVKIGSDFLNATFPAPNSENVWTDFLRIVDRLEAEGYLGKRIGNFAPIPSDANLVEAQTGYLDPLAGIVHHYQIIRDGDTIDKRVQGIFRALKLYVGDRDFSLKDKSNSYYDRIHIRGNNGDEVFRWGFYASRKRKSIDTAESAVLRQKLDVSKDFVIVDRSTPSTLMSLSEAMQEAVAETEWSLKMNGRLNSASTRHS